MSLAWCCFQARTQLFSHVRCGLVKIHMQSVFNPTGATKPESTSTTVPAHPFSHKLLICRLRERHHLLQLHDGLMRSRRENVPLLYSCGCIPLLHKNYGHRHAFRTEKCLVHGNVEVVFIQG